MATDYLGCDPENNKSTLGNFVAVYVLPDIANASGRQNKFPNQFIIEAARMRKAVTRNLQEEPTPPLTVPTFPAKMESPAKRQKTNT